MLGHPHDVEVAYFEQGGIIESAPPGAILVDMTTSSPELARRIYRAAATRQLHALDAPVSGGDIGAREARLSIMVGGDRAPFEVVLPILKRMGSNICLQGGPGCGQHTKMCNQIVVASTLMGVCEGLAYCKHAGLNPDRVLKSIGSGAAGSFQLNIVGSRILASNFAPGFLVEHFVKDLQIAEAESQRFGLDLPGLTLVKQRFDRLAAGGAGREGTQALYKLYDQLTLASSSERICKSDESEIDP
jgi:3-hydroxyisobutyrate dehydrogenase